MTVGRWLDHWSENSIEPHAEPTPVEGYEISLRLDIKPYLGTDLPGITSENPLLLAAMADSYRSSSSQPIPDEERRRAAVCGSAVSTMQGWRGLGCGHSTLDGVRWRVCRTMSCSCVAVQQYSWNMNIECPCDPLPGQGANSEA